MIVRFRVFRLQSTRPNLEGVKLSGDGTLYVIHNSDPMAYNEPGKEPDVKIVTEALTNVPEVLKVPALSINVYKFDIENQGQI